MNTAFLLAERGSKMAIGRNAVHVTCAVSLSSDVVGGLAWRAACARLGARWLCTVMFVKERAVEKRKQQKQEEVVRERETF